jgi:hypothetical protein
MNSRRRFDLIRVIGGAVSLVLGGIIGSALGAGGGIWGY